MNGLRSLQAEFQNFVLHGDAQILDRVVASETIQPARRLGIYYDAYRLRLVEALTTDYPALKAVMGEEDFVTAARAFIEATPSVYRNLRWYGEAFPGFLAATSPYDKQPWLHELARFEWTISLAFDCADEPYVQFEELATTDPSQWPTMTFKFHPSRQRLQFKTNAANLRKAVDEAGPMPQPMLLGQSIDWLLWRKSLGVMFRSLAPEEAWALDTAHAGGNFAELCEGLCQWVGPDQAAARFAGMLRLWVDDQLITAARMNQS